MIPFEYLLLTPNTILIQINCDFLILKLIATIHPYSSISVDQK